MTSDDEDVVSVDHDLRTAVDREFPDRLVDRQEQKTLADAVTVAIQG